MPLTDSVNSVEPAAGIGSAAPDGFNAGTDVGPARATATLDIQDAQELLRDLGFLLVPAAPLDPGRAYLLVALRPRPTLEHFDPERIEYWAAPDAVAEPVELEWLSPRPYNWYSWGPIRVVDRVAAANSFVSFGGGLVAARPNAVRITVFSSDAPILALGGHSGPADPLAASVRAFFARLRAAAGSYPDLGRRAASVSPNALYAAYLTSSLSRYRSSVAVDVAPPGLLSLLRTERHRLRTTNADDECVGRALAIQLRETIGGS